MSKRRSVITAGLAFPFINLSKADSPAEILFSAWTPPKHHITKLIRDEWIPSVEERSAGRLKIKYLPKAPMSAAQTFDGVRDGLVDMSFIAHGYAAGRFEATKIAEMPFLSNSGEVLSVAYERIFRKYLVRLDEHKGVVPLSMFTPGPGHLMATKAPFVSLESVAGKKLRAPGGIAFDLVKRLGATPITSPASELYELLSGGIVDGALMPADVFGGWRLEELIKYATRIKGGFYNLSMALVINPKKYESLDDQQKRYLTEMTGEHFSKISGKASDDADKKGWNIFTENKGKIIEADDKFLADVKERFSDYEKTWAVQLSSKAGIDIAHVLAELRAEIGKIEGK